jgi:hypothetical protein
MRTTSAMAKDVLASLKSGVLLNGTVRSHSTDGSIEIAWIAIELPMVGERVILVRDEQILQPGQQVVIDCVPNPLKPEHYMFRMVEVLTTKPTVATKSLLVMPRSSCGQRRNKCMVRLHAASKK